MAGSRAGLAGDSLPLGREWQAANAWNLRASGGVHLIEF